MFGIQRLHFYCQKVLPLVYDESLSYYEILCKVKHKLNELIDSQNLQDEEIKAIENELTEVQKWIDNFDTSVIKELIEAYIATMIFVEINDAGYIVYNIPESWDDITFNTTQLDIFLTLQPEYGHLVLSY
jgi:hypothetical protein